MKTYLFGAAMAVGFTLITNATAQLPEPKFRAVTIDDKIQIGYGLAIADVDGDGLKDILLADKKQFAWYRNPGAESSEAAAWKKFIMAENLTVQDNVCIAAQDIDGDGKCEVAVGAGWNPSDTVNSGAVFYLIAPTDRTQRWEPVKFPSVEPTTHRMKWIRVRSPDSKADDPKASPVSPGAPSPRGTEWGLLVLPLHGRGNKGGEGEPVKVLCYRTPADVRAEWPVEIVSSTMHMTHNFDRVVFPGDPDRDSLLICGKEGTSIAWWESGKWLSRWCLRHAFYAPPLTGVGEFRIGWFPKDGATEKEPVAAAIEPMHGNSLVFYRKDITNEQGVKPVRRALTDKLVEGHALGCGDFVGSGSDQIAVGWRGNPSNPVNTFGIHLWTPLDPSGEKWRESVIDDGGMACEDMQLADLNGDGKLDIVASGRATKNVKIYFNETAR